jgi:DNA recombination protein RmuC
MESSLFLYLILGASLVINAVVLYVVFRSGQRPSQEGSGMLLIQDQLHKLTETVDAKMGESARFMHESVKTQFGESQRLLNKFMQELTTVTDKVARVEETGKQMVNFADQLQSLQDVLKNPKQRGILGEYYLETLLKNVLPPGSYQMQYPFKDGTIVDAAVFVRDKVIPVDSKFSLENYNRLVGEKDPAERTRLERQFKNDLKLRIDETSKYIKPAERTMEFAFMFIPHEAIYYDLLVAEVGSVKISTRDLIEYAFKEKRVIIVSPTSFLAYLQTVLQGLKALEIEERAQEIVGRVSELGKHLAQYDEYYRKVGVALGVAVGHYDSANKEFKKVDKDILRITGESPQLETLSLERPQRDE